MLKSFLRGKVTIDNVVTHKDDLIPFEVVFEELKAKLAEENEPSWQVLQQFEKRYPELGPGVIRALQHPIIQALHSERIKRIYYHRIGEIKQASKSKST